MGGTEGHDPERLGDFRPNLNPDLTGDGLRFRPPDMLGVIANRPIGGEFRAAGDVTDGHGSPPTAVGEGLLRPPLGFHVTAEVGQDEVGVTPGHK